MILSEDEFERGLGRELDKLSAGKSRGNKCDLMET